MITAPTNNTVEQTLYGVLSVFQEVGVPLDCILRLGVPSSEFAFQYPSLCEDADIGRRLAEIDDRIIAIDEKLAENTALIRLLPDFQRFTEVETMFHHCENELPHLLEQMRSLYRRKSELGNELVVIKGREISAKSSLEKLENEEMQIVDRIRYLNIQVEKYHGGIRRKLAPKRYAGYVVEVEHALEIAGKIEEKKVNCKKTLEDLGFERKDSLKQQAEIVCDLQACGEQIDGLWDVLQKPHLAFFHITEGNFEEYVQIIDRALAEKRRCLNEERGRYEFLHTGSRQELLRSRTILLEEKHVCEIKRNEIASNSTRVRINQCQVLAGTIDTCLFRVTPNADFQPDHIFLDEAGYCSLIKGATLLAYHCPVTLLGDHMQLSPVCEMDDKLFRKKDHEPVFLWAQSVLYVEDIFLKSPHDLFDVYRRHQPARFQNIKKFELTHSYRFGEALGRVLATYVYSDGFHGDKNHDTDIFYINAPRETNHDKRTSMSECEAIAQYLSVNGETGVGIITPYRNQWHRLKHRLGGNHAVEILTVHGSQGREWDTVLFSVTDTEDSFFTHTLMPLGNGKRIVNTAVSRARKKLVIVCDVRYWSRQHKQLIGALLSVAEELRIEKHT